MKDTNALRVGLAVGRGTGAELADVFEHVIHHLASRYALPVEISRSPKVYHSYFSLIAQFEDPTLACEETLQDVQHYENYCRDEVASGTRAIFRTAINAQSLYLVREHHEAVKVECFNRGPNSLLLVRDQAQGFYTGCNQHDASHSTVSRSCKFGKELGGRIIAYSIGRARQEWGGGDIESVMMVYKFHLFDGVFSTWAKEWSEEYGVNVQFVQPDTANRNLLAFGIRGHQLMIAGNEWADIMHVMLLDMFGRGAQETRCTENIYLKPQLNGLSEYQTVHGSADDIAGKEIVNPSATIRAAASILERHGGCKGLEESVDQALHISHQRNATTPDQGGSLSTTVMVDSVLSILAASPSPPGAEGLEKAGLRNEPRESTTISEDVVSMGKKTALLVIDFQNDFVKKEDMEAAEKGTVSRMEGLASKIPLALDYARTHGHEVIFLRFLGDTRYQLPNWQHRDSVLGKKPKCVENTWGADFHTAAQPVNGERVFDRHANFDAFLGDGFERYLVDRGYEHLILLGVYCDVCVDSTARTAFQKGYYITVVSDCTSALHLPLEKSLNYMKKVYGARIVTQGELVSMKT
ncbi:hypothetical protein MMC17_007516 [Xylographa soralifera]|nr:hypothetical protein [Xylographa soralifera]